MIRQLLRHLNNIKQFLKKSNTLIPIQTIKLQKNHNTKVEYTHYLRKKNSLILNLIIKVLIQNRYQCIMIKISWEGKVAKAP